MKTIALQQQLEHSLQRPIPRRCAELLVAHLDYVLEQNENLNLTAIKEWRKASILHIEDSLTALPEIEAAPAGALVDMGSGAGFPGIPLAVVTSRKTCLVEATVKKTQVLEGFLQTHDLGDHIVVRALRAEELAVQAAGCYAVATARALSSLPSLMELAAPLLQMGGMLIAYKGKTGEEEIDLARRLEKTLGMTIVNTRDLTLSDKTSRRKLIVIEKTSPPTVTLPRRPGKAQRQPFA